MPLQLGDGLLLPMIEDAWKHLCTVLQYLVIVLTAL